MHADLESDMWATISDVLEANAFSRTCKEDTLTLSALCHALFLALQNGPNDFFFPTPHYCGIG